MYFHNIFALALLQLIKETGCTMLRGKENRNLKKMLFKSKSTIQIAVLGDSYVSGVGARSESGQVNYEPSAITCMRSPTGWPGLYADLITKYDSVEENITLSNDSCAGAVIANISKQMLNTGIDNNTDLVLMSVGGNNIGGVGLTKYCFVPGVRDPLICDLRISKALATIPVVQTNLTSVLMEIASKLEPRAKVIFVGYPSLVLKQPFELEKDGEIYDIATPYFAAMDKFIKALKNAVQAANQNFGRNFSEFVDVQPLFYGHEVDPTLLGTNKSNPEAWINGLVMDNPIESFHPNPEGYSRISKYLFGNYGNFGLQF